MQRAKPEAIVASWNAAAARIKGYDEAEILGAHFSRFYTQQDRQDGKPQQALRTVIEEGRFEGWLHDRLS
jgi:PAS domain-containing protein